MRYIMFSPYTPHPPLSPDDRYAQYEEDASKGTSDSAPPPGLCVLERPLSLKDILALPREHILIYGCRNRLLLYFAFYIGFVQISYCIRGFPSSAAKGREWWSSLIPSLQLFDVLYHNGVTPAFFPEKWCHVMRIPRLLVNPLLAQVLYHREVTPACCPVQWCITTTIPRLQMYLRSLHHRLHNVQLSSFAGFIKATTMGQVLSLIITTPWISDMQLPAHQYSSQRASSAGPQWM